MGIIFRVLLSAVFFKTTDEGMEILLLLLPSALFVNTIVISNTWCGSIDASLGTVIVTPSLQTFPCALFHPIPDLE